MTMIVVIHASVLCCVVRSYTERNTGFEFKAVAKMKHFIKAILNDLTWVGDHLNQLTFGPMDGLGKEIFSKFVPMDLVAFQIYFNDMGRYYHLEIFFLKNQSDMSDIFFSKIGGSP